MNIKSIQNPNELKRVYSFVRSILDLPENCNRNLYFYLDIIKKTPEYLLCAMEGNEIKGAIFAIPQNDDENGIFIGELAVSKDSRGEGIGSLLLYELEKVARMNKKKSILLASLETALIFYEKHVFIPKLFIQVEGTGRLEELRSFTERNGVKDSISWESEENGFSKVVVDLKRIDKNLKSKAEEITNSHCQFLFFKEI